MEAARVWAPTSLIGGQHWESHFTSFRLIFLIWENGKDASLMGLLAGELNDTNSNNDRGFWDRNRDPARHRDFGIECWP